jgi:hypothetical protein
VRYALKKFGSLLNTKTPLGSKCLVECYAIARGDELRAFQEILLGHADAIAIGKYRCLRRLLTTIYSFLDINFQVIDHL